LVGILGVKGEEVRFFTVAFHKGPATWTD